jgi:hypothetical protein
MNTQAAGVVGDLGQPALGAASANDERPPTVPITRPHGSGAAAFSSCAVDKCSRP